jgi:hypothetical protein
MRVALAALCNFYDPGGNDLPAPTLSTSAETNLFKIDHIYSFIRDRKGVRSLDNRHTVTANCDA